MDHNFYTSFVQLPGHGSILSDHIANNPKFAEFFSDCVGAIDGSHIYARVSPQDHVRYRDRHANISQNILAVCGFDELFTYIMSGWEGSASDALIYVAARRCSLAIPEGKYVLGDAGFPSCLSVLVPYHGVQYHLKEWGHASERYVKIPLFKQESEMLILLTIHIVRVHQKNSSIYDMHSFEMSLSGYLVY